jgi:crotonobetainyl-CoA:carnitine CoA-transferase CaiB-like acyl-CoA transferase
VFATADGYIAMAFANLATLGELIGEESFAGMDDERDSWVHRDEIFARVRERLVAKTSAEWLELFRKHDIWAGPVYGYADVVADPQIAHNGTFVEYDHPTEGRVKAPGFPIRFSRTPSSVERGAPLVGEHSREILAEAGFGDAEIDRLLESGAVRQH